jgi:hypothetical protein
MRGGSCAVPSPGGEGQDEGDSIFLRAPQSKIAEPSGAEADFGGESIPVSPFESTREWLERQGIQVSKIPKGARIISEA